MNEEMKFPKTFEEFIKQYSFFDKQQIYTNGSELIQVFRIKQWEEHKEKENQELKKQLEEKQNPFKGIFAQVNDDTLLRDCGNMNAEINELKNQQKEFINYLEDKIYSIEPKGTGINYNCEYDSEDDYVMAMQEQSRLNTLKETLQKYKEIIGVEK